MLIDGFFHILKKLGRYASLRRISTKRGNNLLLCVHEHRLTGWSSAAAAGLTG